VIFCERGETSPTYPFSISLLRHKSGRERGGGGKRRGKERGEKELEVERSFFPYRSASPKSEREERGKGEGGNKNIRLQSISFEKERGKKKGESQPA